MKFASTISGEDRKVKKLNPQVLFDSKASIRFKSGAYTIIREHFEAACDELSRVDRNPPEADYRTKDEGLL